MSKKTIKFVEKIFKCIPSVDFYVLLQKSVPQACLTQEQAKDSLSDRAM